MPRVIGINTCSCSLSSNVQEALATRGIQNTGTKIKSGPNNTRLFNLDNLKMRLLMFKNYTGQFLD